MARVPVRADLSDVVPYGAPQLDVAVRLNTNETAEPPPQEFLEAVVERSKALALHRYPDRDHRDLREALARRHATTIDRVWAANGSNEILLQLLQAYGGPSRRAGVVRPSYSMYPELCRTTLTDIVTADLDEAFHLDVDRVVQAWSAAEPSVVLLASPNNPVGSLVDLAVIEALHERTRALIVVDEAYIDFAPPNTSATALVDRLDRVAVVRTFSKAFRLAGLRLGYVIAQPWVVDDLEKVRLPYHLDVFKQAAGVVALEQEEQFLDHRHRVVDERERVATALRTLPGVEVFDSAANFLLVRTAVPDMFAALLEHGVLIRDFSRLPRLEGCVRVTIGTAQDNDALLRAFAAVIDR